MSATRTTLNGPGRFWDKIAEKYSKQPIKDEAGYQKKLEMTRRYFRPDMEVLELGCGTGSTAIVHAPHVKHIRATDLSENMLAIARNKAAKAGVTNVVFEQATVDDIVVADGSLDAVLALSLLHLLEDRDAALAKIHRILKPGGVFVSSTVCLDDMAAPIKYILPIGRLFGVVPLVKVFKATEFMESVRRAGFKVEYEWVQKKGVVFLVARK
ncbi:MAG: class I SAM-dependent methyltransferase [Pseudomonadota bacterium]